MGRYVLVMLLAAVLFCGTSAYAEWRVDFESKTVNPDDVGVTVDVTAYWDIPLTGLAVPIVVRQTSGGAFWTGALPYDTGGNGLSKPFLYNVSWGWFPFPFSTILEEFRPGVPTGVCATEGDVGYDGVPPDHFLINAFGTMSVPAQPTGWDFMTFTFDVNGSPGTFEFDTACYSNSMFRIMMVDDAFPPGEHGLEAAFNKGVITISGAPENTPPEITCPPGGTYDIGQLVDLSISATDDGEPDPPAWLTMTAENVPGFLSFTDYGGGSASLIGTPDCVDPGQYTIRFIAHDSELADTCEIVITINEDNEKPMITCPGDVQIDCTASTDPTNTGTATASDNCDPSPTVTFSDDVAGGCLHDYVITRTWRATDASGNFDECMQMITVVDNEDPIITCPNDIAIGPGDPTDPSFTGQATAIDNCDPSPVVDYSDVIEANVIIRTWTATDDCGNEDICIQAITIVAMAIVLVAADNAEQGEALTVHITGEYTCFGQGTVTTVQLTQGATTIHGTGIIVTSSTELDVDFAIPGDAPLGPYDVTVTEVGGCGAVTLVHGFRVNPPACACDCGLPGDVNCDDAVDPLDVSYLVLKVYLELDALCDPCDPEGGGN